MANADRFCMDSSLYPLLMRLKRTELHIDVFVGLEAGGVVSVTQRGPDVGQCF